MNVLVDARNVLRSKWPNIPEEELVQLVRDWAKEHGVHAHVIFDGRAPGNVVGERELDEHTLLIGTGGESADDWVARQAPELAPVWLITSDRGLRARVEAERTTGGGSFARVLTGEK